MQKALTKDVTRNRSFSSSIYVQANSFGKLSWGPWSRPQLVLVQASVFIVAAFFLGSCCAPGTRFLFTRTVSSGVRINGCSSGQHVGSLMVIGDD